jgi:hypothetical protein
MRGKARSVYALPRGLGKTCRNRTCCIIINLKDDYNYEGCVIKKYAAQAPPPLGRVGGMALSELQRSPLGTAKIIYNARRGIIR